MRKPTQQILLIPVIVFFVWGMHSIWVIYQRRTMNIQLLSLRAIELAQKKECSKALSDFEVLNKRAPGLLNGLEYRYVCQLKVKDLLGASQTRSQLFGFDPSPQMQSRLQVLAEEFLSVQERNNLKFAPGTPGAVPPMPAPGQSLRPGPVLQKKSK